MNLSKVNLIYTDATSSDTEIKYTLVSNKFQSPDLLLLLPPAETLGTQKRVFALAKRILKDFKDKGKIAFFATPDNFSKNDTVSQYVFDMFPEFKEMLPEIKTGNDFLLVRY